MSKQGLHKQIGAAMLITLAAAIVVAPAAASSQLDRNDCEPLQRAAVASLAGFDELELTAEIEELEALEAFARIEAWELLDAGTDVPRLRLMRHTLHGSEVWPTPEASHPVAAGIDLVVDAAKLPTRVALVAQHLLEAFAKITPRALRTLL